ncbi:MAG TPA: 16S rRNA (cytosine(1402)-N(4))-methyltransferase RsmH [Patescibacteria group bacterium]|nr:16S rRNA (cytosine(1402)-N(4))-methyltransferase RsmH [Patescibacteria group bacterium]
MNKFHEPVMLAEVLEILRSKPGDYLIDATAGGGGHTFSMLNRLGENGKILAIDLDPLAISQIKEKIKNQNKQIVVVNDNYKNLKKIAYDYKFNQVNGILLDLGLSSGQLSDQARGFSFLAEGRLDMRFGDQTNLTAEKIINSYPLNQLIKIFEDFGEERLAKPIAEKIVWARKTSPIEKPAQLFSIVSEVYKKFYRGKSKINPATKIFQALRIAVNEELKNLAEFLPQAVSLLADGGRLAVLSYHSLEDKIVKDFFRQESRDCLCPPSFPICQCNHKKTVKIITKKPVQASLEEINRNPRARSAKLRVAEKI